MKKLIGAALVLSLTFGITVVASETKADSIKSRGNIEYDSDNDDEPEVLFYSDDLTTISTGIDSLNEQISVLSSSFDTLSDTTSQYKSAIISGLNGNVYSKANIPADTSFTELVGYINNIPAPTTAVGNYYDGGDNSGLGVGISSSNPTVGVDVDGISTINIGVNESITLPSGYYPNDITIQNSVANRGALSKESSEDGYYTDILGYIEKFGRPASSTSWRLISSTQATSPGLGQYATSRITLNNAQELGQIFMLMIGIEATGGFSSNPSYSVTGGEYSTVAQYGSCIIVAITPTSDTVTCSYSSNYPGHTTYVYQRAYCSNS
ncbi:hypothetical protein [Butyrivibrio hungatei]|uniref:Cell surface protein n=1 Tax=Butyrivibrio hungatei TaxID=185008 RepID=A0A1D9P5D6_9FIRM|nr:hypothetical protein [Butyrivibrio hungatei]AOZ97826.1 hypothetical protein bhn_II027 [Butyrivibrio hungatei]